MEVVVVGVVLGCVALVGWAVEVGAGLTKGTTDVTGVGDADGEVDADGWTDVVGVAVGSAEGVDIVRASIVRLPIVSLFSSSKTITLKSVLC